MMWQSSFRGDLFFLSNFYKSRFFVNNLAYETVEHYFNSKKTVNPTESERIRLAYSPAHAKKLGRECNLRNNWDRMKDDIMFQGVHAKFSQDYELKEKLLETEDYLLVEKNNWGDRYWGVDINSGMGLNKLGEILKDIKNIFLIYGTTKVL